LQTDTKLLEKNGFYEVNLEIPCNHLCMLEILPVTDQTDSYAGFDPDGFFGLK